MNRHEIYSNLKNIGFNPNIVVDCGAAWGEWCGVMKPLFPECTMIGIDANKWTPENIPGTDITEITVLSDEYNKEMVFYRKKEHVEGGTFCTGDSLFIEDTQHYKEHNTIKDTVRTETLKSILEKHNLPKIDLLKMDTQGSEILIMKGLGELLKEIEFIELETSLVEYNKGGCSFYDVIEFLKEDFELFDIIELHRHYNFYLCQIDVIFQNKKSKIQRIK
jgi:FkbM family methyltransferase